MLFGHKVIDIDESYIWNINFIFSLNNSLLTYIKNKYNKKNEYGEKVNAKTSKVFNSIVLWVQVPLFIVYTRNKNFYFFIC